MNRDLTSARAGATSTRTVNLTVVAGTCGGGECPTVFQTDRGTLVVQGYTFDSATAGVSVPPGEQMVEIPIELLAEYQRATS